MEEHSRLDGTIGDVSGEGLKAEDIRQERKKSHSVTKSQRPEQGHSLTTVFSLNNYLTLQDQQ